MHHIALINFCWASPTKTPDGTFFVTTLDAATTEFLPTSTPLKIILFAPIHAPLRITIFPLQKYPDRKWVHLV